jgi:hypothetical protein
MKLLNLVFIAIDRNQTKIPKVGCITYDLPHQQIDQELKFTNIPLASSPIAKVYKLQGFISNRFKERVTKCATSFGSVV